MRCTCRRLGCVGSRATRERCCTVSPACASPSTPRPASRRTAPWFSLLKACIALRLTAVTVPPIASPGIVDSELGDGEHVAVRVVEPRDPRAGGRGPDPQLVLSHPLEADDLDAALAQAADGGGRVGHVPAQDGER